MQLLTKTVQIQHQDVRLQICLRRRRLSRINYPRDITDRLHLHLVLSLPPRDETDKEGEEEESPLPNMSAISSMMPGSNNVSPVTTARDTVDHKTDGSTDLVQPQLQ